MDLGLKNRPALVGGASKGLGRAVAEELAREGARVAVCSRDPRTLQDAAQEIAATTGAEVHPIACDLSIAGEPERAVAETVQRFGGLQLLVTNTGGPPPGPFVELPDDAFLEAHQGLLLAATRLIRASLEPMRAAGLGRIVNITSITAKQPMGEMVLSNAYRAGIVAMGKTLARELGREGILVNNVCPGRIATDRVRELDEATALRRDSDVSAVERANLSAIPLGRYGEPAELAALVAFLCSTRASYISGATIQCDGGATLGLL